MDNTPVKLHYYQQALVKKLALTKSGRRFNQLLIKGLASEHMNYHLKKLVEAGLVEKAANLYQLTDHGKDHANLLDDNFKATEKQPKTSVIIRSTRTNAAGEIEQLLNRRLRQPYFGKVGRLTGKVRFGETAQEAAARELYEETGLTAKSYILEEIYRKIRHRQDGVFVQDVVFFIFFITDFSGTLITKIRYQENFWVTERELREHPEKYDLFDDFTINFRPKPKKLKASENVDLVDGF